VKKISNALISVPLRGVTFNFRAPTASELPELMALQERLKPASGTPGLRDVALMNAVQLGLLWEAGHGQVEDVGALDASAYRPPEGISAPPEALRLFGELVLAELSEAGVGFGDLQVLAIHVTREMMGTTAIQEAVKAADFTGRR